MDINQHIADINANFDLFLKRLGALVSRYSILVKKPELSRDEAAELGTIEHFLIEINARTGELKNKLDQDLFGHSLDMYYLLKQQAAQGDLGAQLKFDRFRASFVESLREGSMLILN